MPQKNRSLFVEAKTNLRRAALKIDLKERHLSDQLVFIDEEGKLITANENSELQFTAALESSELAIINDAGMDELTQAIEKGAAAAAAEKALTFKIMPHENHDDIKPKKITFSTRHLVSMRSTWYNQTT